MKKLENSLDIVYISDKLEEKFESFYREFICLLEKNGIGYCMIPNTKDIWSRDFMPIQISPKKIVSYKYEPDYLKEYIEQQTKFDDVDKELKLHEKYEIEHMDIVLDGGNVIKHGKTVILTDKIFTENPKYEKDELLDILKDYLEVDKVVIIPWDKEFDKENDYFGHADGMIRFINQNKVLVNGFIKNKYKKEFQTKFFDVLKENNLEYEILDIKNQEWGWGYINFLQLNDFIILPKFGIYEDRKAEEQIKKLYPNHKVLTIYSTDIAEDGGVLNCISWNTCC